MSKKIIVSMLLCFAFSTATQAATPAEVYKWIGALEGSWKLSKTVPQQGSCHFDDPEEVDIGIAFKYIARDTTIQEELLPDTEKKMVTMYHCKDIACSNIKGSHYCVKMNQPQYLANLQESTPNKIIMECDMSTELCNSNENYVFKIIHEVSADGKHLKSSYLSNIGSKRSSSVWETGMKDKKKTNKELISELADVRSRFSELEDLKHEVERANQRLRESAESFRRLVEVCPYGIGIASDGVAVFINDAVAKMLGATERSEIVGKPVLGFVHESSMQAAIEHMRQVILEGKPVIYSEQKFVRLDGELVDVEVTATPFTYHGKPSVQAMFHDITAQKKAERALQLERQKFRSLSEQAPFAMAIIAKNGEFQYINPKFKEMFGYDLKDVPNGKHWFRRAYPDPAYRHELIRSWVWIFTTPR